MLTACLINGVAPGLAITLLVGDFEHVNPSVNLRNWQLPIDDLGIHFRIT